KAFNPEIIPMF
nr:Chain C, Gag protein [synthetic construct]